MLYIFLVDTGSMLTLDVDLALKPVSGLCAVVESAFGIPQEKQVRKEGGDREGRLI